MASVVEFYAMNGQRVVSNAVEVGPFPEGRLGTVDFLAPCDQIEHIRIQPRTY